MNSLARRGIVTASRASSCRHGAAAIDVVYVRNWVARITEALLPGEDAG
jgi:hypothetical protein